MPWRRTVKQVLKLDAVYDAVVVALTGRKRNTVLFIIYSNIALHCALLYHYI